LCQPNDRWAHPKPALLSSLSAPLSWLLVGAAVLFNGIRLGEVMELGLAPGNTRGVNATISVASTTPVRADTKVGPEFQGLTGVPVIALEGGTQVAQSGRCRR
jgi:phospholipid/cholesterol/gamma-HCH transport system substrate-binding protein